MTAVFGLGNPASYNGTRHNVGREISLNLKKGLRKKKTGKFCDLFGAGRRILIVGRTYMNESGMAFSEAFDFLEHPAKNILVICDDINIPLGKIRYRVSGSSGGHKGLESIIEYMGSLSFPRLRIGIGFPADRALVAKDWVLGTFEKKEVEALENIIPLVEEFVMEHWGKKWPIENFSLNV